MYSISNQDQSRYYRDRHLDRDTRNRYDKDSYRIYHRYERDQSGREKYYSFHQAVSHSDSQYYANSGHSSQSGSYIYSHMTSHKQRQNEHEHEYKHYPVTQQRDDHYHSRYSQQGNYRHLVSRSSPYSQTVGSQPTAYSHSPSMTHSVTQLAADSHHQSQSTTSSFSQVRTYYSNQSIGMTNAHPGGSSQSDGSWSSANFHYQIGQGGSLQADESQSSANLHIQTASSQSAAQFHNHVDRSQPATHSFIQLTNDAFIPISHSLSPSELKTLKDKLLNVEQGLLDAKNKLFNNLAEQKRKLKNMKEQS